MKKRNIRTVTLFLVLMIVFSSFNYIRASETIVWSEVKTGVYDKLHPYTLNWTGDVLDKGGFSLLAMSVTTDSKKTDFVINQYGSIGASGILELNEDLEDNTSAGLSGFTSSLTIGKGDVFLIILQDGSYAKIRIDRYVPDSGYAITKVFFSYVVEGKRIPDSAKEPIKEQPIQPSPNNKPVTTPEIPASSSNQQETNILLSINNKSATVNGNSKALEVSPIIVDGRTLVPLRFIAESLGLEVLWDKADRRVTLNSNERNIILWIDRLEAKVNGATIKVDVPAKIINNYTMVPVRFISENLNQNVVYNSLAKTILITNKPAVPETTLPNSANTSHFIGIWKLWVSGSMVPNYEVNSDNFLGSEYTSGAGVGTLEIRKDGTYTLKHNIYKTSSGNWRVAKKNEVWGYDDAIILSNISGYREWTAIANENGNFVLSQNSGGTYTDGSIIWIIDSQLYK